MDRPSDKVQNLGEANRILSWMNNVVEEAVQASNCSNHNKDDVRVVTTHLTRENKFRYALATRCPNYLSRFFKILGRLFPFVNFVIRIEDAFFYCNSFPEAYNSIKVKSLCEDQQKDIIAVHVRRGDVELARQKEIEVGFQFFPDLVKRYMTESEYIKTIHTLLKNHPEMVDKIEIFTDSPKNNLVYSPLTANNYHEKIEESDGSIKYVESSFELIKAEFPKVKIHYELNSISSLIYMANAKYLILSKSSFSYVAAILNRQGTIVYTPFWHQRLMRWIEV